MRYYWELTESELYNIRQKVAKALELGDLIPQPCEYESCNVANTVAHHENYDKPLDITWLCRPHHRKRHAEINKLRPKDWEKRLRKVQNLQPSKIKLWPDNYEDVKPFKFMAHFPDICPCKNCTLKRKEKAWQNV